MEAHCQRSTCCIGAPDTIWQQLAHRHVAAGENNEAELTTTDSADNLKIDDRNSETFFLSVSGLRFSAQEPVTNQILDILTAPLMQNSTCASLNASYGRDESMSTKSLAACEHHC